MRLTLIKPNIGRREHSLYVDEARMEPLPLGILAALTPEDVEVVLYDDRMETIPYDTPTDLVGITVDITNNVNIAVGTLFILFVFGFIFLRKADSIAQ